MDRQTTSRIAHSSCAAARKHRRATLLLAFCLFAALPFVSHADTDLFPEPPALAPDVEFWVRIYSEVTTSQGLIHDVRHLGVVYEKLEFPEGISRQERERRIARANKRVAAALRSLARGKRKGLNRTEKRALAAWSGATSNPTLRSAASHIRFQTGQADRFREGLIRSGRWLEFVRETFRDMGIPEDLVALPHVESSYNPKVYSRVGAAGLWQFTRPTGRRFLRIDHVSDERLDPFLSTRAAGRLLQLNREVTGSWPLAITAYNHGAAGVRRAIDKMGTREISSILRHYRGRSFGFASRNFYAEFLAARKIQRNPEKYFGALQYDLPMEYETHALPYYVRAKTLRKHLHVRRDVLEGSNPSLRSTVWTGAKHIPRGHELRIPRAALARPLSVAIADLPDRDRLAQQTRDRTYTVRRGDSLSRIAARAGVSVSQLVALNTLKNQHHIRVGQKLRLASDGGGARIAATPPQGSHPGGTRYKVRRGDSLSRIAARYGISARDIARRNGLDDHDHIRAGQTLHLNRAAVPTSGTATQAPSSSLARAASAAENRATPGGGPSARSRDLAADPSDYSVSANGTIEVQATETLGHYAEWLDLRTSQLRAINRKQQDRALSIGSQLRLDFSHVSAEEFHRRRLAHHRDLQDAFFDRNEIEGTRVHVAQSGDSLWGLAAGRYRVPLWLLRQYNPDLDLNQLRAGTRIVIPVLKARNSS